MKLLITALIGLILTTGAFAEIIILDTENANRLNSFNIPGVSAVTGDQFLANDTSYTADQATQDSGISANGTAIGTNVTDIATNAQAITTKVDTTVYNAGQAQQDAVIGSNTQGIAGNAQGVAQNTQGIQSNYTGIQNNAAVHNNYVQQQATVDAGQDVRIDNNSQDIQTNRRLYDQLRAQSVAMDSVELNPSHIGWSVGVGISPNGSTNAGAVGVMYGEDYDDFTVGYNLKGYMAEGTGGSGFGTGVTIAW